MTLARAFWGDGPWLLLAAQAPRACWRVCACSGTRACTRPHGGRVHARARGRAMDVRFCARVHVRVDAGVDQAQGAAPVFSAFVGVCGFMGLWLSSRRLSGFVETKGRSLTEIQRQLSL